MQAAMNNKFILTTLIFLFMTGVYIFQPEQAVSLSDCMVLEDFQEYADNPFSQWEFRESYKKAASVYSIIEENNSKFLRGSTRFANNSVQLGRRINKKICKNNDINWDINSFPCISWDWRIKILPAGGNEDAEKTNDSAAGIYIVFPKNKNSILGWQYQPAYWIKYVWSTTLPVGTVISRKFSRFGISLYEGRYIVVASGEESMEKWITFKRNVLQDYITYFGKPPVSNPIAVGILTDSNDTGSQAEADYDNIKVYTH